MRRAEINEEEKAGKKLRRKDKETGKCETGEKQGREGRKEN